jgi:gliding motility-associated-like protein
VATVTKNLVVAPGPIADFSLQQVCYGRRALFTNQSTITGGTISKYYWNLGNGTIDSVNTNTTTVYPANGNYNVQLIAVSENGCRDTALKPVSIIDSLKPNFTFPASNCQQSAVQFTNTSTGNYTGYTWYFGDAANTTSTAVNPVYTYPTDGSYTVKLVVNHAICGKDSIQKLITIKQKPTVTLPQNIALCTGSLTTLTVPNTFDSLRWNTNQTINTISVSGTPNPIRVDVYKNGCANFATTTLQLKPKPNADFSLRQVCYGVRALFTNQSTISGGSITKNYWSFGNGLTDSVSANPSTVYPANNNYNVQLITVSDNGCRDTVVKNSSIIDSLKPNFIFPTSNCQLSAVQFSNTSTGNYTGYSWDFGVNPVRTSTAVNPAFTYPLDGTFPVKLVVNHAICGKDSIVKNIIVKPKPTVTLPQNVPLCNGTTAVLSVPNQFDSLRWNTNETTNSITVNGTVNPLRVDVYKNGCTGFATTTLQLKPKPDASFATDKYCSNKPTAFLNTSAVAGPDSIVQYNWSINNGAFTAQQPAPVFNLNQIINYNVQLIVTTNSGCRDTFTRVLALRDTFIPAMTIPASVCIQSPAQFADNSRGDNISFSWQFGDGRSSTQQNPLHTYNSAGNFPVKLIIQNKNCGVDSTSGTVAVKPRPRITLDDSIIMCPGEQRTIIAGGDFDSVFWSNGVLVNPATIDGNQPAVSVIAFKDGCSSSDSVRIVLNCDIYIPTAFTPNNDGFNDLFNLIPLNIISYNMRIYNRWGELVFETEDLSKSWDGTHKGVACPVDSYVYAVSGVKKDNQSFSIKGTLTLLR